MPKKCLIYLNNAEIELYHYTAQISSALLKKASLLAQLEEIDTLIVDRYKHIDELRYGEIPKPKFPK